VELLSEAIVPSVVPALKKQMPALLHRLSFSGHNVQQYSTMWSSSVCDESLHLSNQPWPRLVQPVSCRSALRGTARRRTQG